ncbi:MAG: hypothetical protein VB878_15155, partial [Pirellulaceae bacterium]
MRIAIAVMALLIGVRAIVSQEVDQQRELLDAIRLYHGKAYQAANKPGKPILDIRFHQDVFDDEAMRRIAP